MSPISLNVLKYFLQRDFDLTQRKQQDLHSITQEFSKVNQLPFAFRNYCIFFCVSLSDLCASCYIIPISMVFTNVLHERHDYYQSRNREFKVENGQDCPIWRVFVVRAYILFFWKTNLKNSQTPIYRSTLLYDTVSVYILSWNVHSFCKFYYNHLPYLFL